MRWLRQAGHAAGMRLLAATEARTQDWIQHRALRTSRVRVDPRSSRPCEESAADSPTTSHSALEQDLAFVKAELAELRSQSSQHATLSPASGSIPRPPTFDYRPPAATGTQPLPNGVPPSSATIQSMTPQSVAHESDLPPPELLNMLYVRHRPFLFMGS